LQIIWEQKVMMNICFNNKLEKDKKLKLIWRLKRLKWFIFTTKWGYNRQYQMKSSKLFQKIKRDF
jgi:hypothetical protein